MYFIEMVSHLCCRNKYHVLLLLFKVGHYVEDSVFPDLILILVNKLIFSYYGNIIELNKDKK